MPLGEHLAGQLAPESRTFEIALGVLGLDQVLIIAGSLTVERPEFGNRNLHHVFFGQVSLNGQNQKRQGKKSNNKTPHITAPWVNVDFRYGDPAIVPLNETERKQLAINGSLKVNRQGFNLNGLESNSNSTGESVPDSNGVKPLK